MFPGVGGVVIYYRAALGLLAREAFFSDGQGTPSPPRSPFPSSAQFAEIRAPKAPLLCLLLRAPAGVEQLGNVARIAFREE